MPRPYARSVAERPAAQQNPADAWDYRGEVIALAVVNVGVPTLLAETRGEHVWSGIAKRPVDPAAVLWLSEINLSGDGQADLSVHGGPDKAVYAYPSEHLGPWRDELGTELGPAPFGENLSTIGALESDVRIGDVWSWGDATLQVCQPRWPCFKLALHRQRADIQARMRTTARTGWYLRVLEAGEVPAAGPIEVSHQDPAGVTVEDAHLAMSDRHLIEPGLVRAVAEHRALARQWRLPLLERLDD
jgi:MOSC domain-containing protein YiiM